MDEDATKAYIFRMPADGCTYNLLFYHLNLSVAILFRHDHPGKPMGTSSKVLQAYP
jgi:hypothetical protein